MASDLCGVRWKPKGYWSEASEQWERMEELKEDLKRLAKEKKGLTRL